MISPISPGITTKRAAADAAVSALLSAHAALNLALDGIDAVVIRAAAERYRAAIFDVRAAGIWRTRPDIAKMAADLLGRVESRWQGVNNLTATASHRANDPMATAR